MYALTGYDNKGNVYHNDYTGLTYEEDGRTGVLLDSVLWGIKKLSKKYMDVQNPEDYKIDFFFKGDLLMSWLELEDAPAKYIVKFSELFTELSMFPLPLEMYTIREPQRKVEFKKPQEELTRARDLFMV